MAYDIETLHNLEKQVLLALKELGPKLPADVIIEKTKLSEAEINKGVEWLKEKGLISVEEENKERFVSAGFALKYVEEGLPEKRILKVLLHEKEDFNNLAKKTKLEPNEVNVSLGLLKKNGYVSVSAGKVSITDTGKEIAAKLNDIEERTLGVLKTPQFHDEIPKESQTVLTDLINRKLVIPEPHNIKHIVLTADGKKVLPHIKIEDVFDVLTPEMIVTGQWKNKKFRKYNINSPVPPIYGGKKQAYLKFVDDLKQKLISMGFKEMNGPAVELSFFNNEALYMPQDHPAREIHDVFHLKKPSHGSLAKYSEKLENVAESHENGWRTGSKGWGYTFDKKMAEELLLRSQTTAVSARKLCAEDLEIPGKYFSVSRNFRVDEIDWKHLAEFDQFEGIIIDPNITFKEVLGMLKIAAEEIGGCTKFKYTPVYYPFTEPSVDLSVYMEGKGWIEIGGAGIFRPELTQPLGIKEPVIAWGLGILRLFMTKYNINDMRQIFSTDLKWLRNFKW